MENEISQHFNIQFVANITGINPHTIRAWEKRYDAISPTRDTNGRRIYTEQDISRLKKLNLLVKNGNTISDIANLPNDTLDTISEKFIKQTKQTKFATNFDLESTMKNLLMGLNFFKLDIIAHEIAKASNSLNCRDFALDVVAPYLLKIREAKKNQVILPNQRDSILTILRAHIFGKLVKDEFESKERPKIVLACPKGQLNEVSTLLAALLCQAHNLNFYFLGSQVSALSLAEIVKQFKADVLFLGLRYSVETFTDDEALKYQEEFHKNCHIKRTLVGTFDKCLISNMSECIDNFERLDKIFKELSTYA